MHLVASSCRISKAIPLDDNGNEFGTLFLVGCLIRDFVIPSAWSVLWMTPIASATQPSVRRCRQCHLAAKP